MKKSICILLIILLAFSNITLATQQVHDHIIFYGEKSLLEPSSVYSPLQRYYYDNGIKYPFKMTRTSNWRGHVATWEIVHNQMYLIKVTVDGKDIDLGELFPKSYLVDGKVKATWFFGMIKLSLGEALVRFKIKNSTRLYQTKGPSEIVFIEIMDGEVTKEYRIDAQEYFIETDRYEETGKMKNKELQKIYREYIDYINTYR